MNKAQHDEILNAIEEVARIVRERKVEADTHPFESQKVLKAIDEIAFTVRTKGQEAGERLLDEILRAKLKPIDPFDLKWNIFKLFNIEYTETQWTQWLAAILDPQNGERLAQIVWRSFCDAVVATDEPEPEDDREKGLLALHSDWEKAEKPSGGGCVQFESSDPELGRLDIAVDSPNIYVIIENKIEADWSNRIGEESQAERYRKIGLKRLEKRTGRRLGLVLLTEHEELEREKDYPKDYLHLTYRGLGQALRKKLNNELNEKSTAQDLLELWPALLTLVSIEQGLLQIDPSVLKKKKPLEWKDLDSLNEITAYLNK